MTFSAAVRSAVRSVVRSVVRLVGRSVLPALCALVLATPCAIAATASAAVAATDGFYRLPSLRGGQVWFTAEGDIWRVAVTGGVAERITTHPGSESRAEVSPDGRWLAFIGTYEGPSEAYVMPVGGGVPKRLTWDGQNPVVWGWTPSGEALLTVAAPSGQPSRQLVAIDPATGARRALPVAQASDGALSADGKTLYFTRSGLRGDNARGYRGGATAQLWQLDLASQAEARPLLAGEANMRRPMPYATPQGPRIAFLSDQDGSVNIWSVEASGGDLRQHSRHAGWDVRHAGIDGSRVVYALGADLHLLDLAAQGTVDSTLAITMSGDSDQQRVRWVRRPQTFLTSVALAPNGERAALAVRGHLATQGVGALRRAELPTPPDARCRDVVFSPDGKRVYALCSMNAGSEVEAWSFAVDGSGTPEQITQGASTLRTNLAASPDGKWLAHGDKEGRISLTALTGPRPLKTQVIDASPLSARDTEVVWSPDSRALVITRPNATVERNQLLLYTLATSSLQVLTSDRYDSGSPSFTPDGKWLYFLSARSFQSSNRSPWGDRNLGPYFDRRVRVYALALQPGLRFPFQARDELDTAAPTAMPVAPVTATVAAGAASATVTVAAPPAAPASAASAARGARPAIVAAGLPARLYEVPLAAGNYTRVVADDKRLYVQDADADGRGSLRTLAIDNSAPQPELFADDVKQFEMTPDGKKLLILRSTRAENSAGNGDILLVDAAPKLPADTARNQVRWTDWQIAIDPRAEWRQLFGDAWRLHRDSLFDAGMRGVDWPAMRGKYDALLPRVRDRAELTELLAQMVGELGVLHSQVVTPDLRIGPDEIGAATLGARTTRVADGFRIDHIYRGDAELPSEAGPLATASLAPGVTDGPQVGDVITAVNGRRLDGVVDLSEVLRGQAGRQVLLQLKRAGRGERQAIVLPISAQRDTQLRTGDWERASAAHVVQRSQGRVGYLRLRAMGAADIATFAREFYAQIEREGIVIDVRGNNGGSIDSWIIEKLLRRSWAYWKRRSPAESPPHTNMQQTFRGHLAVLVDEDTYSDGETFAEGIKRLQLGALIGKRTSGAGVWLSDGNRLQDNGMMRAAETAQFGIDGSWLIEGRGVTPDIVVDNLPRATFGGADAQLDAAVDHLLRRLETQPLPVLTAPPFKR